MQCLLVIDTVSVQPLAAGARGSPDCQPTNDRARTGAIKLDLSSRFRHVASTLASPPAHTSASRPMMVTLPSTCQDTTRVEDRMDAERSAQR
ncbi:hypothetical protein BIW11_12989 [Tropilaelaps mercedesae]|uniref:Uncharacterized protein n=1 Tax=Tropilaelaps mercedesae TaxID=418985 RepID=A0A1V9X488_9ACAR|nr:hypothetical protein BIW11_12989 [Tropilaelaps mercedesae]